MPLAGLRQAKDIAIMYSRFMRFKPLAISKLNVAAEKIMSPIAHSPMTLSPLAAV
jgi:hypothetical protein